MKCQWQAFLNLLPGWMRTQVDSYGKDELQELRLRLGAPPELVKKSNSLWLERTVTADDLNCCVNMASRYSPWTAETVSEGYITASGGHRIGLCGEVSTKDKKMQGIRSISSICIRVARDFPGIAAQMAGCKGSVLIIGCPGSGKTTFLRDLIRQLSDKGTGCVAVVDERKEIFPFSGGVQCFPAGKRTDILTGCSKAAGIETVLRTMGPRIIAVDEITAREDCIALQDAMWCGIRLLATAHAANRHELYSRTIYRPIIEGGLFDTLITIQPDKSWQAERISI